MWFSCLICIWHEGSDGHRHLEQRLGRHGRRALRTVDIAAATIAQLPGVGDGGVGKEFEQPDGVVPFRGHRQRLDRYDELDFDALEKVMRELGLWSPHIQRTADW